MEKWGVFFFFFYLECDDDFAKDIMDIRNSFWIFFLSWFACVALRGVFDSLLFLFAFGILGTAHILPGSFRHFSIGSCNNAVWV